MPVILNNRFLLLYGSQTGQAKAIAEDIAEKAEAKGLHADIHCLSQTEKKFKIERESCVVLVISTTGDGEPPDTALKFVRHLKKKTLKNDYLSTLNYTLLGLGDSNYTNFCNCGKTLNQRLLELSAKPFYPPGWADDAVGLEVVAEPWIENLIPAITHFLKLPLDNNQSARSSTEIVPHIISEIRVTSESSSNSDTLIQDDDIISVKIINCKNVSNANNERSVANDSTKVDSDSIVYNGFPKERATNGSHIDLTSGSKITENTSIRDCEIVNGHSFSERLNGNTCDISSDKVSTAIMSDGVTANSLKGNNAVNSSVGCKKESDTGSLMNSVPPLSESSLTVPILSPEYLKVDFLDTETVNVDELPLQNGCSFPSAASPVVMATVQSIRTLTAPSSVKKTLVVTISIAGTGITYRAGDAISVVCPNPPEEVEALLKRLGLQDKADTPIQISVIEGTKKKSAAVPKHVPPKCTLRHLFTTCLDFREPPKKALLRALIEYTSDASHQRRLQELCSKQGAGDYTCFIREPSVGVLDLLDCFTSCMPPVTCLIEHLSRLQPRPYSVCTSSRRYPDSLQFVFNVVEIPAGSGRSYHRKGLCTGWLEGLRSGVSAMSKAEDGGDNRSEDSKFSMTGDGDKTGSEAMNTGFGDSEQLSLQMQNLSLNNVKIPIFARTNQNFHLPDDLTIPLILIGPGTGVAPLIGFLQERAELKRKNPEVHHGEVWLFYGCRHRDRDYLFRDTLEAFVTSVVTRLCVSFSRDDQPADAPRYVQGNMRRHGSDLVTLIQDKGACVYVCGDARNMAKDVNEAFVDIFAEHKGLTKDDSSGLLMKLRLEKRYREDVWT
ncbi:methionine synthase reductase-like [Dreissena polymorpha]|uniref:methionine synthase reductase-like n=1 Tax=Dreissena polymorpha TaxID=45954 RepID=UPI002264B591|nr:methionine synthase reductase-like [Dreissena polymorpha]